MTTVDIETFTVDQKIELGLIAVARHNGNTRKAAKELEAGGHPIPRQTLYNWVSRQYKDEYLEIREKVLPFVRAHAADRHMAMAESLAKANEKIVSRLSANVDEIPPRDLPGAARNLSVATAVETEKAEMLNDQPTHRVAIDLQGTLAELKSLGVEPRRVLNLTPTVEEDVPDDEKGVDDGED